MFCKFSIFASRFFSPFAPLYHLVLIVYVAMLLYFVMFLIYCSFSDRNNRWCKLKYIYCLFIILIPPDFRLNPRSMYNLIYYLFYVNEIDMFNNAFEMTFCGDRLCPLSFINLLLLFSSTILLLNIYLVANSKNCCLILRINSTSNTKLIMSMLCSKYTHSDQITNSYISSARIILLYYVVNSKCFSYNYWKYWGVYMPTKRLNIYLKKLMSIYGHTIKFICINRYIYSGITAIQYLNVLILTWLMYNICKRVLLTL